MDLIIVFLAAIIIFVVFVAITAFFLKSALDLHKRTMDAVASHNAKHQDDLKSEDNEIEEKSQ
ncbi:MAG: hypothetical protein A4E24_01802 [Methanomethylovorans sp. PtaU1.Bin093]|jgi:uncharacterized protein YpmB|uniref:hypothetical protein n=1 Tax=Methanomethylovorans sp. PtaU1.Bin093 TaxID=1811679 RepID=UPI0009C43E08|nr:hypothetical protein [Methanomethylovorans sp. PtaU1.Bin093]OPY18616.1 MAG: hypothetical protein A4E24_01802 [Methanomethylovorans sp. PtaU1.Bin093]